MHMAAQEWYEHFCSSLRLFMLCYHDVNFCHLPCREHMNVVFIGHVDAGKSTTGGQILYLTVSS